MAEPLHCFRCGASLETLTLPLSRRDLCPGCSAHVHVCRMCIHYAPAVVEQCLEDDAEEVGNKESANYCDWFKPRANAFNPAEGARRQQAEAELAALFGESSVTDAADTAASDAEKLFK